MRKTTILMVLVGIFSLTNSVCFGQKLNGKEAIKRFSPKYFASVSEMYRVATVKLDSTVSSVTEGDETFVFGLNKHTYSLDGKNISSSNYGADFDGNLYQANLEKYTYNTKGLLDSVYISEYDDVAQDLVEFGKAKFEYTTDSKIEKLTLDIWNPEDKEYMRLRLDYTYNTSGQLSNTVQNFVYGGVDYSMAKTDYEYTQDGDVEYIKEFEMGDEDYSLVMQTEYAYIEKGQVSQTVVQEYNQDEVTDQMKYTYEYTNAKVLVNEISWYFNGEVWIKIGKSEFSYDNTAGNYIYPVMVGLFEMDYKSSVGKIDMIKKYGWEGDDWSTNAEVEKYYYSELTGTKDKFAKSNPLMIFPNPAETMFAVAFEGNQEALCSVFDMSGKLVLNEKVSALQNIDISNLESGLYTVLVSVDGVQVGAQKLMKK